MYCVFFFINWTVRVGFQFIDADRKVMAYMCGDVVSIDETEELCVVIGAVILSKWENCVWFDWGSRPNESREKGLYMVTATLNKLPKLHRDEGNNVDAFNLNNDEFIESLFAEGAPVLNLVEMISARRRQLTFHYVWAESDRWWLHQETCLVAVCFFNYFTSTGNERFKTWLRSQKLSYKRVNTIQVLLRKRNPPPTSPTPTLNDDSSDEEVLEPAPKKRRTDVVKVSKDERATQTETALDPDKLYDAVLDRAFKASLGQMQAGFAVVSVGTLCV